MTPFSIIYPENVQSQYEASKEIDPSIRLTCIFNGLVSENEDNIPADFFGCKRNLFVMLFMGTDTKKYMPRSYLVDDYILSEPDKFPLYIAKSNRQRQLGIKILKRGKLSDEMKKTLHEDGVVLIQALILNPLYILDRKLTMRYYALRRETWHGWFWAEKVKRDCAV